MGMKKNRMAQTAPLLSPARMRLALGIASSVMCLALPTGAAAQVTPQQAKNRCYQYYNSVQNLQELAYNQNALVATRRCIELGIDPPLKMRPDYGRSPASGVATAMIPGTTCPPFATCLYSARVNNNTSQSLNYGVGGQGGSLGGTLGGGGTFSAPQFTGHLPPQIPEHLEDGSTIYFYGEVTISPPANSLLYPDGGTNYYADGAREVITNGHVMTPPAPNGDIMAQRPVIVNEVAKMNFDDGGIIVIPANTTGFINGREVRGGDIVIINHTEEFVVPAGTALYPFPMGSHPAGEHADDHNHAPYTGPPIKLPTNVDEKAQNPGEPGIAQWWQSN